jgi:hypothetical protein
MGEMKRLRFILILALTVVLDFSSPIQTHAAEGLEEFEEVVLRHRGGRVFRLVRDTVPPAVARQTRAAELAPSLPRPTMPLHAHAIHVLVRKIPPAVAEPSPAPEAH